MLAQPVVAEAMRRALELALRGPENDRNPRVGCVILDPSGIAIAEGWHLGAGTQHAETAALDRLPDEWRSRASELTAVVTLEPCNHTGLTGPCAIALSEAGIGTVVYALDDPGLVSRGGADTLRRAGVEVHDGVLAKDARSLLRGWIDAQSLRVTVKWAQTLDGRAAAADGTSQWITGLEARSDVHRRRAEVDAILVGTGTLIADDPALTARDQRGELLVPPEQQPTPVIFGRRAIPPGAKVLSHPALAARGLEAPLHLTGEDLARDLAAIRALGARGVFVEGGPTLASSLLAASLVDEVLVYVAPGSARRPPPRCG